MKNIVSDRRFFSNVGNPPRKPLRTFKEFAEEFGVTTAVLASALKDDDAPCPIMQIINTTRGSNRWYDPIAMRRWWKARGQP